MWLAERCYALAGRIDPGPVGEVCPDCRVPVVRNADDSCPECEGSR